MLAGVVALLSFAQGGAHPLPSFGMVDMTLETTERAAKGALIAAVNDRDAKAVRALIKAGHPLEERDKAKRTPFCSRPVSVTRRSRASSLPPEQT